MKNQLFFFCMVFMASPVLAQNTADTIFKRNKEVLLGKVIEIGIDEVKYKPIVNPNGIVLVLEKSEIERIVFATGMVQTFEDPLKSKKMYAGNHQNNIKFNFLSPIGDRAHFNWEHSLMPGMSYEVGVNFIGLGKRFGIYTPVGAVLNAGLRFYKLPDMKSRSDRYSHIMNGSYFQPTLAFGTTRHHYKVYELTNGGPWGPTIDYNNFSNKAVNTNYLMFFLNFGRQFILENRLSFDISAGIGYGTYTNQNVNNSNYFESGKDAYTGDDQTRYGFAINERQVPLAVNAQFKIGYLLK